MKRDESVYLRHILDATIKAEEYLQGLDEIAFKGKLAGPGGDSPDRDHRRGDENDYLQNCDTFIHTFRGKTSPACVTNSFTITSGWILRRSG